MARIGAALAAALLACACGGPSDTPVVTPPPAPSAAVQTEAPPDAPGRGAPGPAAVERPVQAAAGPVPLAPVVVPAGALYACVVNVHGERQVSAIDFAPKVAAVCARDPEMGPCQYAREACRAGGGRVFAANGREITRAIEAEYDRRVLRVWLKSN